MVLILLLAGLALAAMWPLVLPLLRRPGPLRDDGQYDRSRVPRSAAGT